MSYITKSHKSSQDSNLPTFELPVACERLPWETDAEYAKFQAFLLLDPARSVRQAYRAFCEQNGIKPKKDPGSNWFKLARGEYSAFAKAKQQLTAIERASQVHGRVPDWEGLEVAARAGGHLDKHPGEFCKITNTLLLIEWAFWSLAIDNNGDPILGQRTWVEIAELYHRQKQGESA